MKTFAATGVFAFAIYLLLTAGSGDIGIFGASLWSLEELFIGLVVALITSFSTTRLLEKTGERHMVNPLRWPIFMVYILGPFLFAMLKANIDVAYRVLTGYIRPGIVRIESGLTEDLDITILANSITLTPGTLTVDVDEETKDLFIHCINVPRGLERQKKCDAERICGNFPRWIRRMSGW